MGVELACWCGKGGNWVVVGYSRPKWNNYGWKGSCKMGADPSEGRKTEGLDAQMEASTSCCVSVTESHCSFEMCIFTVLLLYILS